jgi:organic hydroperoxide reductase OsmC/OhrA
MLWYLHLCADAGVNVLEYTDDAIGIMVTEKGGVGKFIEVTLNPQVVVSEPSMIEKAIELHQTANQKCFIANSVNFPVHHQPMCTAG